MRMRSNCINSTSGRKFLTGNGFSDPDFLKFRLQTNAYGQLEQIFKPEAKLRACA